MAEIRPFRALHYPFSVETPWADLIAPPYDVIPPRVQAELLSRHPNNVIRLILGDPSALDDPELSDPSRYADAAKTLADWTSRGILVRDDRPALYLVEDRFEVAGRERMRLGVLAAVRLEPFERKIVLPHERTLAAPIHDRHRLMQATRMHESPVFLTFEDTAGAVRGLFESVAAGRPVASIGNRDEPIRHRLFRIEDADFAARLASLLAPAPLLIADGHHRYTTACRFARTEGRDLPEAQWGFAYVTPAPSDGLILSSIQRVVRPKRTGADPTAGFSVREEEPSWERFLASGAPIALSSPDRPGIRLLTPADGAAGVPSALLNERILKPLLGIDSNDPADQRRIVFVKDPAEARPARGELGFWLRPLDVASVVALALRGEVLPQKSTYFFPKIMSGLAFHPFWD